MSKLTRIATPLMAVAIMSSVPFMALAQSSQALTSTTGTVQASNTPSAGTEQTQGYRDGTEAAKLDKLANRPISYKTAHLYVHPPVKGDARDAYRTAFQSGYEAAVANGPTS
jgi:hypothetical protein